MGYYIPNDKPIESLPNVVEIQQPSSLSDVGEDEAIICQVDNNLFKANGFAYSESELKEFLYLDGRLRKWFKMPLDDAKRLSNYNQ